MRRLLCLVSLLSLTITPAMAESFVKKKPTYGMSQRPKKPGAFLSTTEAPLACQNPDIKFFSSRSQSNLINLFENVACTGAGEIVSNDQLDLNYCKAIYKCKTLDIGVLSDEEKDFLEAQALDLLIRENTQNEMGKYSSSEADEARDLESFISKLPAKYQPLIKKCQNSTSKTGNVCVGDTDEAEIIQSYIGTLFERDTKARVAEVSDEPEVAAEADQKPAFKVGRSASIPSRTTLISRRANLNLGMSGDKLFDDIKAQERLGASFVLDNSTKIDPEQDNLLNDIYVEVLKKNSNVLQISSEEIKDVVRSAILKSSRGKSDYILSYKNKKTASAIDQILEDMHFKQGDFLLNSEVGRASLFDKINNIRVKVANFHLKEDCGKTNNSIDQVCSNLSVKMSSGSIIDVMNDLKNDPFKRIIDYYQKGNLPKKNKNIETLTTMKAVPSKAFEKYFAYSMQSKVCGYKFPKELASLMDSSNNRGQGRSQTRLMEEKREELKQAYEESRASTVETIKATAKTNNAFRNEMQSMGFKTALDAPKNNSIAIDVPTANNRVDNNSTISKIDESSPIQKNFYPDQIQGPANKVIKPFESTLSENLNNFNSTDEHRREKEGSDYESKLRARLADLESREKAMTKKVSQVSETRDDEDADGNSELTDLRRQIEELKNAGDKGIPQKSTSAEMAAAKAPQKSSPLNGKNTSLSSTQSTSVEEDERAPSSLSKTGNHEPSKTLAEFNNSPGSSNDPASRLAAASTAGGASTASKAGAEKSRSGIILTQSGEVMQDPSKILDNPQETEIVGLLEVTNGQPFLIRENGILMKVTMELDSSGKPQIANGKPRFKKIRLSKSQEATIVKEANLQKSMKEVERDPTRLFNLKSLIKGAVKRE